MFVDNGQDTMKNLKKINRINVFGVGVDDLDKDEVEREIVKLVKKPGKGCYLVTVNSEFIMLAHRNRKFARILAKSDISVADGWWVAKSRLICGGKAHDRVTGVELIEMVSKISANNPIRIGYMGGFGDVAAIVAKRQENAHKGMRVVFESPGVNTTGSETRLKLELDAVGRIDVLFVALGMGKQEFWIDKMKDKLNVGLYIGVGGAFDYLAGKRKRAPEFLQNIGLEWLWRLLLDPARIWRMRVLPQFFLLVVAKFLKNKISKIF